MALQRRTDDCGSDEVLKRSGEGNVKETSHVSTDAEGLMSDYLVLLHAMIRVATGGWVTDFLLEYVRSFVEYWTSSAVNGVHSLMMRDHELPLVLPNYQRAYHEVSVRKFQVVRCMLAPTTAQIQEGYQHDREMARIPKHQGYASNLCLKMEMVGHQGND